MALNYLSDIEVSLDELLSLCTNLGIGITPIFLQDDLYPMRFLMNPATDENLGRILKKFKKLIEMCGGVLKFNMNAQGHHGIRMVHKEEPMMTKDDYFLSKYILDCVRENDPLDLQLYRVNESNFTEELDVNDILAGRKSWDDAVRKKFNSLHKDREVAMRDETEIAQKHVPVEASSSAVLPNSTQEHPIRSGNQPLKEKKETTEEKVPLTSQSLVNTNINSPSNSKESDSLSTCKSVYVNTGEINEGSVPVDSSSSRDYIPSQLNMKGKRKVTDKCVVHLEKLNCKITIEQDSSEDNSVKKLNEKSNDNKMRNEHFVNNSKKATAASQHIISSTSTTPNTSMSDDESESEAQYRKPRALNKVVGMYTEDDDVAILKYLYKHNLINSVKGRAIWQEMEERSIVPQRSWQGLKERYMKRILPRIRRYKCLSEAVIQAFSKRSSQSDSVWRRHGKGASSSYSTDDDRNIIAFIVENKRFEEIKAKAMWVDMSKRPALKNRTWQSLKNRFLRYIYPYLHRFKLPSEQINAFNEAFRGRGTRKPTSNKLFKGQDQRRTDCTIEKDDYSSDDGDSPSLLSSINERFEHEQKADEQNIEASSPSKQCHNKREQFKDKTKKLSKERTDHTVEKDDTSSDDDYSPSLLLSINERLKQEQEEDEQNIEASSSSKQCYIKLKQLKDSPKKQRQLFNRFDQKINLFEKTPQIAQSKINKTEKVKHWLLQQNSSGDGAKLPSKVELRIEKLRLPRLPSKDKLPRLDLE